MLRRKTFLTSRFSTFWQETWSLRSDPWYLECGTWNLAPDTWNLASDSWSLTPGTWHLGPGIWNLRTWNLAPHTWNLRTCHLFAFIEKRQPNKYCLYHFPKIHRNVLRKTTIDLLYFWDVDDVNLWEKKFCRSTAYSCRTNIFI